MDWRGTEEGVREIAMVKARRGEQLHPDEAAALVNEVDRLTAELATTNERIETLTQSPEPLEDVQEAAIEDRDFDYVLRMMRKARAAFHGSHVINEDLRFRLLDAEDALAAKE